LQFNEGVFNRLIVCATITTHTAPALTSLAHPVAEAGKIAAHLLLEQFAMMHRAISEGIPIRGYLHWTLVDDFD
jgi:hypothetical protein